MLRNIQIEDWEQNDCERIKKAIIEFDQPTYIELINSFTNYQEKNKNTLFELMCDTLEKKANEKRYNKKIEAFESMCLIFKDWELTLQQKHDLYLFTCDYLLKNEKDIFEQQKRKSLKLTGAPLDFILFYTELKKKKEVYSEDLEDKYIFAYAQNVYYLEKQLENKLPTEFYNWKQTIIRKFLWNLKNSDDKMADKLKYYFEFFEEQRKVYNNQKGILVDYHLDLEFIVWLLEYEKNSINKILTINQNKSIRDVYAIQYESLVESKKANQDQSKEIEKKYRSAVDTKNQQKHGVNRYNWLNEYKNLIEGKTVPEDNEKNEKKKCSLM